MRGGVAIQTIVVAVILAAMSGVMGGEIVMLGLVASIGALGLRPWNVIGLIFDWFFASSYRQVLS